jgi:ketosteroid isomerase-like protein
MRALALLTFACLAAVSLAQKPAAQKAVEKQIAKYCQAMQRKDIKGVQAVVMPDFIAYGTNGKSAKGKDVFRQMGDLFYQVKKISLSCTITSFKMDKGNARIVSKNVMDVELPGPDGKIGKLHNESTSDELWVPAGGTYKVQTSKQLTNTATFNGKPVTGG